MEKITTRRREGVGVVVEKWRKSTNFQQKFVWFRPTYSNNAHAEILFALYKTNKQFNKKTKLWKQNGRCLDDVTTAL